MEYGISASPGFAMAKAYVYQTFQYETSDSRIEPSGMEQALRLYHEAKTRANEELQSIIDLFSGQDDGKTGIFLAHQDILDDEELEGDILSLISEEAVSPDRAIETVYDQYIAVISAGDDPLIRERAKDLSDVKTRLIRCWHRQPEHNLACLSEDVIVVARDLFPSDTAALDRAHVKGIVTEAGGITSHTAILAKSYGIPAVLGVPDAVERLGGAGMLALDAVDGTVSPDPDPGQIEAFRKKARDYAQAQEVARTYLDRTPVMKSGERIHIELNISAFENAPILRSVDGIGLFRTEFLYMGRQAPPSEEEQYQIYRDALQRMGGRPVTLRTMDIGGDKQLDYLSLPKEDNPFLGRRALRLSLAMPELFHTQLRAALRASVHGELWLMFPMVGSLDDVRAAKNAVGRIRRNLEAEGVPVSPNVKLGIMVEIPSIALIADLVAGEVDFISIGTNDLCQYLTASDRLNPDVTSYYQPFHPAMFRLIGHAAGAMRARGKAVGVCGELGGDPRAALALVGLGVDHLSMSPSSVARVKQAVCSLTLERAREIAVQCRRMDTAGACERYLTRALEELLNH